MRAALATRRSGSARWGAPRSCTQTVAEGKWGASAPAPPAWSRWMCVTTMWARSRVPMPRAPRPSRTDSTEVVGPVSTSAGSAASNVSTTGGVYPRPSWATVSAVPARLRAVEGGGGWSRRQLSSLTHSLAVVMPNTAKFRTQDIAHDVQNSLLVDVGLSVSDMAFLPRRVQQATPVEQPFASDYGGKGVEVAQFPNHGIDVGTEDLDSVVEDVGQRMIALRAVCHSARSRMPGSPRPRRLPGSTLTLQPRAAKPTCPPAGREGGWEGDPPPTAMVAED